jgi:undecaprenyl-diphosphatase
MEIGMSNLKGFLNFLLNFIPKSLLSFFMYLSLFAVGSIWGSFALAKDDPLSTQTTVADGGLLQVAGENVPANTEVHQSLEMGQSELVGSVISPFQAFVLGVVEGVTEYLPVSSTGHLVIASELIGVRNVNLTSDQLEAVEAYEIVIQSGAILAVIFLYFGRLKEMCLGLMGRSPAGLRLFSNIVAAFLPTAFLGLLLNKFIKTHLQHSGPVIAALAVGGLLMILFDRSKIARNSRQQGKSLGELTLRMAIVIGLFQSLAMWPGTSRSMMTILGGMLLGLNPIASAEFSFLLGLPTLLAATLFKGIQEGPILMAHVSLSAMTIGLVVAGISALLAVRGFVSWLNKHGLAPFGYYRILVAFILFYFFGLN